MSHSDGEDDIVLCLFILIFGFGASLGMSALLDLAAEGTSAYSYFKASLWIIVTMGLWAGILRIIWREGGRR